MHFCEFWYKFSFWIMKDSKQSENWKDYALPEIKGFFEQLTRNKI